MDENLIMSMLRDIQATTISTQNAVMKLNDEMIEVKQELRRLDKKIDDTKAELRAEIASTKEELRAEMKKEISEAVSKAKEELIVKMDEVASSYINQYSLAIEPTISEYMADHDKRITRLEKKVFPKGLSYAK